MGRRVRSQGLPFVALVCLCPCSSWLRLLVTYSGKYAFISVGFMLGLLDEARGLGCQVGDEGFRFHRIYASHPKPSTLNPKTLKL